MYTSEPGVQIYTGNFLPKENGQMVGRDGCSYTYQGSFCAEPQNFPDAINHVIMIFIYKINIWNIH